MLCFVISSAIVVIIVNIIAIVVVTLIITMAVANRVSTVMIRVGNVEHVKFIHTFPQRHLISETYMQFGVVDSDMYPGSVYLKVLAKQVSGLLHG